MLGVAEWPTRLMKRAKIVLMAAEGEQNKMIAEFWELTVAKCRDGGNGLSRSDWRELKRISARWPKAKEARTMAASIIDTTTQISH